jgi:hypothetical protein
LATLEEALIVVVTNRRIEVPKKAPPLPLLGVKFSR